MQKERNAGIRKRLNIQENLMQVVARRKMQLFGHITRMDNSRKIKVVMQGIIEGENKRGRPPRE